MKTFCPNCEKETECTFTCEVYSCNECNEDYATYEKPKINNELLDDCKWFADKHRGKNKQSGPYWSTVIRFPKLYDEAVRLQKRIERLQAEIECLKNVLEKYADHKNWFQIAEYSKYREGYVANGNGWEDAEQVLKESEEE